MNKKKHIVLSYIFTVLGVIVGLFNLIILLFSIFRMKTTDYPLVGLTSIIVSAFMLFSQVYLVVSTIRYRKDQDYKMPVIPVAVCIIVGFLLNFPTGQLNSLIQEKFILPNADVIESIPTGISEDFSYFDISVYDFEKIFRYKMHAKGYDSGRMAEYDGDQKGFSYVIHLDNGDDILLSLEDESMMDDSYLAGVKYIINSPLSTEDTEKAACNAYVSVMSEMFIKPYDQETSEHISKLNSENVNKLTENEEGSFICKHLSFSYETPDNSIAIVPTPEEDK
ncbi:MAG: hypothetical protein K6F99_04200 [Lachnospiraceae bacterium]|nr:hypothetical protein [Lachnospiraceae bacterium]